MHRRTLFIALIIISNTSNASIWWPLYSKKQYGLPSILQAESHITEYDFIIVGGGTAGSVIAGRLAEVRQWNVLIVEAGGERNHANSNWEVTAEPQAGSCLGATEQRCQIPAGKGLGGNTLINNMLYVRGSHADYDNWAKQGNRDWSYRSVLPYFLKLENARFNASKRSPEQRGQGGPLPIEGLQDKSLLAKTFLAACNRLNITTDDYNAERRLKADYVQITHRRGRRITASDAYLKPVRKLFSNLHVLTAARVTKVLINPETKQAVGVQVLVKGIQRQLLARKEIILSAGPIFTPHLLLLSGIGPKEQLESLAIPVLEDLPVGTTMHLRLLSAPVHLQTNRTLPHDSPTVLEALAFLNLKHHEDHFEPSHEILFQYEPQGTREYFSIGLIHLQPASKGSLRLNTTNPMDNPLIYTNFFTESKDMDQILQGITESLKIVYNVEFAKYGLKPRKFKPCHQFRYATDDYWRCVVRYVGHVMDQPYGTCPMGSRNDKRSVVSAQLKVHGISKLRVVDASIIPSLANGHTQATVYMIAEKASDMIKDDWNWGNELVRRR